jgi:hypothetical protein
MPGRPVGSLGASDHNKAPVQGGRTGTGCTRVLGDKMPGINVSDCKAFHTLVLFSSAHSSRLAASPVENIVP